MGLCYGEEEEKRVPESVPAFGSGEYDKQTQPLNLSKRALGNDWPYLGETMTGNRRLDNVRALLEDVFKNRIPGDYIEMGVWRGGSSMFARGVIRALGQKHRKSFVCDSFRGLPPGERGLSWDRGWDNIPYLEVSAEIVAGNFKFGELLDENVIFAKDFINNSIPVLSKSIDSLAIIRFDVDIYESAVDVFYNLYDKLTLGGYFM